MINKQMIDLSTLEQGDTVVLADGQKALSRWTDEDMKSAFYAGKPTLESLFKHDLDFDTWFEQYKESKNETV